MIRYSYSVSALGYNHNDEATDHVQDFGALLTKGQALKKYNELVENPDRVISGLDSVAYWSLQVEKYNFADLTDCIDIIASTTIYEPKKKISPDEIHRIAGVMAGVYAGMLYGRDLFIDGPSVDTVELIRDYIEIGDNVSIPYNDDESVNIASLSYSLLQTINAKYRKVKDIKSNTDTESDKSESNTSENLTKETDKDGNIYFYNKDHKLVKTKVYETGVVYNYSYDTMTGMTIVDGDDGSLYVYRDDGTVYIDTKNKFIIEYRYNSKGDIIKRIVRGRIKK